MNHFPTVLVLKFPLLLLPSLSLSLCVCTGDLYSLMSKLLGHSKDVARTHRYNPRADLVAQIDSLMQKKDLAFPSASLGFQTGRQDPVLARDRVHRFHQLQATSKPHRGKMVSEGEGWSSVLLFVCHLPGP